MSEPNTNAKKQALLSMLEHGLVMLHIDARREDVHVPTHLKEDLHLRLNLSYKFGLQDLEIDDESIRTTLSFQRQPFYCQIPWSALWGLSQPSQDEQLTFFPDAMPIELVALTLQAQFDQAAQLAREMDLQSQKLEEEEVPPPQEQVAESTPTTRKRPALRLVTPSLTEEAEETVEEIAEEDAADQDEPKERSPSPKKHPPPTLRLIKNKE